LPPVPDLAPLHPVSRLHLEAMTDGVGILQHAIGSWPDPAHGYCVDDVARAIQVDLLHGRVLGWAAVAPTAERGLRFLAEAFDPGSGRLRNFRSIDGSWIGGLGSDDSYGRAMLALADVVATAPDDWSVDAAAALLDQALPAARELTSPRAEASVVLGCAALQRSATGGLPAAMLTLLATRLHDRFRRHSMSDWPWPEVSVTYENALLPRALIVAGRALDSEPMVDTGLRSLDWLIDAQTSPDGHLSPIGNEWWPRGGRMSRFDQQPIEATTLLLAAESALAVTGSARYEAAMERSYAWFLGANDLGLYVADPARGACGDGLTSSGVNRNEGAESTLMWLTAAEHIRALRGPAPRVVPRAELLVASTR
jgi:hypothetical protein